MLNRPEIEIMEHVVKSKIRDKVGKTSLIPSACVAPSISSMSGSKNHQRQNKFFSQSKKKGGILRGGKSHLYK